MKILFLYFSMGGRTKMVAETIAAELPEADITMERIQLNGKISLMMQNIEAIKAGDLSHFTFNPAILDVSGYDMICFGVPIYGGAPPAVFNGYLKKATGFEGKDVVTFATGRISKGKMLAKMQTAIEEVGGKVTHGIVFRKFFKIKTPPVVEFAQQLKA